VSEQVDSQQRSRRPRAVLPMHDHPGAEHLGRAPDRAGSPNDLREQAALHRRICFQPDWPAEDYFTAMPSILETLPEAVEVKP
jgi:hypothetical protein